MWLYSHKVLLKAFEKSAAAALAVCGKGGCILKACTVVALSVCGNGGCIPEVCTVTLSVCGSENGVRVLGPL